MRFFIVLLTLPFLTGFAHPTKELRDYYSKKDWSSLKSHFIAKAKSERELDANLSELERWTRDFETCQQQLKLKVLPLKCFDVVENEKRLQIANSKRIKETLSFLNQLCVEGVEDISVLSDPRFKAVAKATISPKCRTALLKRLEILKYKAMDSDPQALFDLRM